ncbi:SET domain-containing protein [Mycena sp. CBHHK59/15]|nr:SET domain-containing protein [Mycena sp. CBHHK59/15]
MADTSELLAWFQRSGGTLDSSSVGFTVFPHCGRGAVALKDIPEGHVLFSIPRALVMSTNTSTLPGQIGLDRWREMNMHVGWSGLILCMMWETAQGPSSKWSKYLESLPSTFDTPMFWSDLELEELRGTSVVGKLGKADADRDHREKLLPVIESRPDIFPPETIPVYYTLEIYHVMGSRVLSRSFDVEKDDDEENDEEDAAANTSHGSAMDVDAPEDEPESAPEGDDDGPDEDDEEEEPSGVSMVPLADMLNARYGFENAKLFYEKDNLRMVSTKLIQAGEQIWNTYCDLPNAELLRRYGHVDMLPLPNGEQGNPGDVVEIPADIAVAVLQTDAAQTKERIDWWLEQGGDDVVVLESNLDIPQALASLIRLLRLTPDEWRKAVEKDKVPKPKIDAEILDVVGAVLERRLKEYPTSLADDAVLVSDESLSLNKRQALIVRIGEKRILHGALEKTKALQKDAKTGDGGKKRKSRPEEKEIGRTTKSRKLAA